LPGEHGTTSVASITAIARSTHAVANPRHRKEADFMLSWALIFLLIALIAGLLGFGEIAAAFAGVAKVLFFVFIVIFLVTLVLSVA
jgi:uncharacterized membrane protein YtjA (UPF0391 family)